MNNKDKVKLENVNWLLGLFGGQLFELEETAIDELFCPSEEVVRLLKRYWGDNASFRNLHVYKNPDYGKEIVNISQALIVETIINEYKNAKNGYDVKDLFLTAPTGAGKSLLFQLPAFYISSQKDVTIVVSPLIALMKDQVEQIRQERGFEKVYFINSELSLIDRERVIEDCKNGAIDILYLSPELLLSYDITYFIGENRNLGLLVIDEAHLITTWGRDFRVDYWFLGQYVNKVRKNHKCHFPMVAVTATAIYGGDNDMVFDSINSLYMHDPHLFIGEVKRNNITFVINNHDRFAKNYNTEKEKETAQFIEAIADQGVKTILYAPYRRHIDILMYKLEEAGKHGIAVAYHSGLSTESKNLAYSCFKDNQVKVMISTKAFGMGVDIPDIQLVYHHAPSGLLPDYVQEIGRAARKQTIDGFAALSYSVEDQVYSKRLYGMSALTHYQIREVLNKINKTYLANGCKRNMLLSADDFCYIFDNVSEDGLSQKVMTSLMMIEKDYLAKCRFNVLIARPKKLFVKVYSRVNQDGLNILQQKYSDCYTKLWKLSKELTVVELDLNEIWKKSFSKESFPVIKHRFYEGALLEEDNVECKPLVKVVFKLESDFNTSNIKLELVLDAIQNALAKLQLIGHYFSKEQLNQLLVNAIPNSSLRDDVVKFLLTSYSRGDLDFYQIDNDAFLQCRRTNKQQEQYRVFNNKYWNNFAKLKQLMQKLFVDPDKNSAVDYTSYASEKLRNYIRLGCLMEILGIGSFESQGGNTPMIFIRINDPRRIAKDAGDKGYKNSLLTTIERRHKCSSDIFDHFFLHSFENEERWDFIEDFFLGESNDDLFAKYPGGERNQVNIVSFIQNHKGKDCGGDNSSKVLNVLKTFLPMEGRKYNDNDLLTIDKRTMQIKRWLVEDPVELDKIQRKYSLIFDKEMYKILMSKLRYNHFPYYRDIMGLKLWIEFPGYKNMVVAEFLYKNEPINFYKWWKKNEDKVTLSRKELLELLLKVNECDSKLLLKRHKELLSQIL